MRRPAPRWVGDTMWAVVGVAGAVAGIRAIAPALTLTAVGTAYQHRMDAEDALLLRELPGYADYAATTRRVLPRMVTMRGDGGRRGI